MDNIIVVKLVSGELLIGEDHSAQLGNGDLCLRNVASVGLVPNQQGGMSVMFQPVFLFKYVDQKFIEDELHIDIRNAIGWYPPIKALEDAYLEKRTGITVAKSIIAKPN